MKDQHSVQPLVSIVMPVYMVEKYIKYSVESVIRQTYKNIELILVDDGTKDNSINIAEKILSRNDVIYRIIHQENMGLGEARNTGINAAKGEWICCLDSDDTLSDNAIEHMVMVASDSDVDIVFSKINEITEYSEAILNCPDGEIKHFTQQEIQKAFLLRTKIILAPGTFYRKKFLDNNQLRFEKMAWSEDQHFVWRALYYVQNVAFLDEPLYQYYRHQDSIMGKTKPDKIIESYHKIVQLSDLYRQNIEIGAWIVPRWVMGTMNATTIMMNYQDWKTLAKAIEMREYFKQLQGFPANEERLMAALGLFSRFAYYYCNRIRKTREKGKLRRNN